MGEQTRHLAALAVASILVVAPGSALAQDNPPRAVNRVVDMVVAQVDTTVITLSELIAETRLVLLRSHGPERAQLAPLTRDLLRAVLRAMVSRELLLAEARRLQLRPVPQSEVIESVTRIRAVFSTGGDYTRFLERVGFTVPRERMEGANVPVPPALVATLRAEKQVERFIELSVRPAVASVSAEEVEACFKKNGRRLDGQPLERVRPIIEQTIRDERAEALLRTRITDLAAKATMRFAPDFKPDEGLVDEPEDDGVSVRCLHK